MVMIHVVAMTKITKRDCITWRLNLNVISIHSCFSKPTHSHSNVSEFFTFICDAGVTEMMYNTYLYRKSFPSHLHHLRHTRNISVTNRKLSFLNLKK